MSAKKEPLVARNIPSWDQLFRVAPISVWTIMIFAGGLYIGAKCGCQGVL